MTLGIEEETLVKETIEIIDTKEKEAQTENLTDRSDIQDMTGIEIEIETEGMIGTEIMTNAIEMIEGGETGHQEDVIDLDHLIAVIGIEIVHQTGKFIFTSLQKRI